MPYRSDLVTVSLSLPRQETIPSPVITARLIDSPLIKYGLVYKAAIKNRRCWKTAQL